MKRFVQMLETEQTAVEIVETRDARYFTAIHQLVGDVRNVEYEIEYFDGEPVTLSWTSSEGRRVRLNSDGQPF